MAEGPDGNLYVVDLSGIQVFTTDGRHVRQIGRKARSLSPGPGEYATVGAIGFVAGRLWATDPVTGRLTLFGLDGEVVDTWPVSQALGLSDAGLRFLPVGLLAPNGTVVAEHPGNARR